MFVEELLQWRGLCQCGYLWESGEEGEEGGSAGAEDGGGEDVDEWVEVGRELREARERRGEQRKGKEKGGWWGSRFR